MVLPYSGNVRSRGPLGFGPYQLGGRIPGPLGFKHVNLPQTAATAARSLRIPPPWVSSTAIRARVLDWKLSNGRPITKDVMQGALPNCPIAAILAALAHTPIGQKYLDSLITEYKGAAVKTVLSADLIAKIMKADDGNPDNVSQDPQLFSNRFFRVKLGKSHDVHDTFYVKYSETKVNADLDLVFMGSPNNVLWPAVIEKACALHFGSYIEIGNHKKHTANDFWQFVVGAKEKRLEVKDDTDVESIRGVASNAGKVPAMGASRENAKMVTGWHGFAVLGMQGAKIQLYDPAKAKESLLSLEDFRSNFQMILYGNPP